VVDTRHASEYANGHLRGALQVSSGQLSSAEKQKELLARLHALTEAEKVHFCLIGWKKGDGSGMCECECVLARECVCVSISALLPDRVEERRWMWYV
jgi:hypothetical protein